MATISIKNLKKIERKLKFLLIIGYKLSMGFNR
jgi:hypothetical protein